MLHSWYPPVVSMKVTYGFSARRRRNNCHWFLTLPVSHKTNHTIRSRGTTACIVRHILCVAVHHPRRWCHTTVGVCAQAIAAGPPVDKDRVLQASRRRHVCASHSTPSRAISSASWRWSHPMCPTRAKRLSRMDVGRARSLGLQRQHRYSHVE